jgi:hypothetical protein
MPLDLRLSLYGNQRLLTAFELNLTDKTAEHIC